MEAQAQAQNTHTFHTFQSTVLTVLRPCDTSQTELKSGMANHGELSANWPD